jgi:enoyl-[acyl-carrier protein] reductase III
MPASRIGQDDDGEETMAEREGEFEGKLALVTGSGRGIGRAIALELARRGADVVVNYFRNREPAEAVAEDVRRLGRKALLVKANVGEMEKVEFLFEQIQAEFGYLDIFVNNAASGYNRPVMEQTPKGWDWTLNINARAFLFCAQRAVPLFRERGGGHIVALSSPGAQRVLPEYSVVGASKAALESLVRYLSVELAPDNIVVNAVSPGLIPTDVMKHFAAMREEDMVGRLAAATPAGRLATPEDVAKVAAFLCSEGAYMIRGQTLVVDGGATLTSR